MKPSLADLQKNFDTTSPATASEIARVEHHFGYLFPDDYKAFLSLTNGLEGSMNGDYLVLWSTNELIELNQAYQVANFVKHIIIFGSDGAEDAFAFDTAGPDPSIIKLPFIGMGHIPNERQAGSFEAFLLPRVQTKGFFQRLFS
jgi:hypothetical protein